MMSFFRIPALIAAILVVAACQPNAIAYKSDNTGQWYGLFYSPADHVEELVTAGDFVQASTVWQDQRPWFTDNPDKQNQWLPSIKQGLFAHFTPSSQRQIDLVRNVNWPQSSDQWPETRRLTNAADTHLKTLKQHDLLWQADAPGYGPDLQSSLTDLRQHMDETIVDDFFGYDLVGDRLFGDVHPYPDNLKSRLAGAQDALTARIAEEHWQDLAAIDGNYRPFLPTALRGSMADRYYRARVDAEAGSHRSYSEAMLTIWQDVHDTRKMQLSRIPDDMLQIFTMLNPDGSDFDLAPEAGPVASTSVPWQSYDPRQHYGDADVVLIMVSQDHQTDLVEDGRQSTKSQYFDGMRDVPNPAYKTARSNYDSALRDYNQAVRELNRIARESCDTAFNCETRSRNYDYQADTVNQRERDLDSASFQLDNTSTTISEPYYRDYRYDLVQYKTSRSAEVLLLEFNNLTGEAMRYTWLAQQAKTFSVPENLHAADEKADNIRKNNHKLADARDWAKADFRFGLSEFYLKVDDTDIQRARLNAWLPRSQ